MCEKLEFIKERCMPIQHLHCEPARILNTITTAMTTTTTTTTAASTSTSTQPPTPTTTTTSSHQSSSLHASSSVVTAEVLQEETTKQSKYVFPLTCPKKECGFHCETKDHYVSHYEDKHLESQPEHNDVNNNQDPDESDNSDSDSD